MTAFALSAALLAFGCTGDTDTQPPDFDYT